MIYYICLLISIFFLRLLTYKFKKGDKFFVFISCLLVVLFQGFRDFTVGIDLAAYIPAYTKIGESLKYTLEYQNFEPAYVILNKILYSLNFSDREFLIIISAIINIPIFYTIYKNSDDKLMSILWYFSFGEFVFTFSGLRQSISMAICFAAYPFLRDKKLLPFCLSVLVASLFHSSALLCFVMYPAYHLQLKRCWLPITLCVLGIVYMVRNDLLDIALPYMGSYGSEKYYRPTGAYTMFAFYLLLFVLSYHRNNEDFEYKGFRCLLFILVMIYSFAPVHMLIPRYGFVFELYMSLYFPIFIKTLNLKPQRLCRMGCYAILSLSMLYLIGQFNTLPFSFDFTF